MPNLRNARGEPTSAIYGVISMLKRLQQDYKADYAVCVFDAKGKTFRDDLYPDYKAQRPPMPQDLANQIEPIYQVVEALGWPVMSVPGVEADDVIGTLAARATEQDLRTVISTGDKDLAQLVNTRVSLVNTMSNETQDEAGVIDRFGVGPERITDYLMLVGDTSDNIPGVPNVGPKTAARWLNKYGSLDDIIKHADEIKGVAGENLRKAIPQFELTRQLVTIKTNCDIPEFNGQWNTLALKSPDKAALIALYNDFGFRKWLREVTGDEEAIPEQDVRLQAEVPKQPATQEYLTINDWDGFDALLEALQQATLTALDTETTSLDPMQARLVGVSFSVKPGQAYYIPVGHNGPDQPSQLPKEKVVKRLRAWLEDSAAPKVLHNAKYDTHVFHNEGVTLAGVADDTMLQAYVLESHRRVNLESLAERWLGRQATSYEELCGKGAKQIGFNELDVATASHYACEDADLTLQLHKALRSQISASKGLESIYQLEIQTSRVLAIMEIQGVALDTHVLAMQSHELGKQLKGLEEEAHRLAEQPFNLNSPKQLGEILFTKMGMPIIRKTATGAPSTSEEVLTRLAQDYPLPKLLLEYRGLAKLKSTYTDKLPKMVNPSTSRVHTRYSQASVITGRLASSDPNLQNIPVRTPEGRRVRTAFIAGHGHVVSADYSQIELRVMAHLSGDQTLRKAFEAGKDIHRVTASEVFDTALDDVTNDQRYAAKAINFGLIYGMGEFGLANNLGITRSAAKSYIDRYFTRYPGVAEYMENTREQARAKGYVETIFGRRIGLPELGGAKGPRRAAAERAAINAPVQGSAADLIKMAMVAIQAWLEAEAMQSLMVMQVHDELVFDAPQAEVGMLMETLPTLMAGVATLSVPLVAEVGTGPNWEQAH